MNDGAAVRRVLFPAILVCAIMSLVSSQVDAGEPSEGDVDFNVVQTYLRKFQDSSKDAKRIGQLIKQLGDDDFRVREAASASIKALPVLPRADLERAAQSEDAEVKWRAEALIKQGDGREQVQLLAAMRSIARQKHKGLLAELITVVPYLSGSEGRSAGRLAIVATATKEDAASLRELLASSDADLRVAAVMALGASLGKDAVIHVKPLLKDQEDEVQLASARLLADVGDRDCLETYLKLLESQHGQIRWEAQASLAWLSGKSMKFAEVDEAKRQVMVVQAWREWVTAEGRTAALRFPLEISRRIDLFNGADLSGWQAVHSGQRVEGKDVWSVKDGILKCNGQASGYLRTNRLFRNYELSVDWRWPQGGGANFDSGVWFLFNGPDAAMPNGLEAQLGAGNAGDFWTLGNFRCKVKGQNVQGLGRKFAASSEKPVGQWNTMTIQVKNGAATIKVNGVEQNAATDCPKEPGYVALQVERHGVDFRNITLLPLDD